MKIQLLATKTGELVSAFIEEATYEDMPLKKDGWNFNWRELFRMKGAEVFKINLEESPEVVEGIMVYRVQNKEMVELNNVELASYNIGSAGKYKGIAGALFAFCCLKSQSLGKGNYVGFVNFESKTALISYYQKKYGAKRIFGQKMYFDLESGKKLIGEYLNLDENE